MPSARVGAAAARRGRNARGRSRFQQEKTKPRHQRAPLHRWRAYTALREGSAKVTVAAMPRRPPSGNDSWTELVVDVDETATAADALAGNHSLALIKAVATPAECENLCSIAAKAASEHAAKTHDSDGGIVQIGRFRGRLEDCLDRESQALCDSILCRAIAQVRAFLPTLLPRFFGELDMRESIIHHHGLVFSAGEPAINLYTTGGHFDMHTDKQSLTILVPLSHARDGGGAVAAAGEGDPEGCGSALSPDAVEDAVGFRGGGTAFFSRHVDADASSSDAAGGSGGAAGPKLVVKPSPGTAIVFCGGMRHAGVPVLEGTRCVLVASFSAKVNVAADPGGRSGWVEHPTIPQVYMPAKPRTQSLQARALAEARAARKAKTDALAHLS